MALNFLNEGLYIIGNVVFSYAYLLAPIALVLLSESFQPIFVLAIGIFFTNIFPKITNEFLNMEKNKIILDIIQTYLSLVLKNIF